MPSLPSSSPLEPGTDRSFPSGRWSGPGRRSLPSLVLFGASLLAGVSSLEAQTQATRGLFLGRTSSRQVWSGASRISTESAPGLSLGAYVDVQTPISFLSVRAELGYIQRGSLVWDDELDPDHTRSARVRSHNLSVPIQGKLGWELGPLSAYLVAGPTLDLLLDSGCSPEICPLLRDEKPTVFGVSVGGGMGMEVGNGIRTELEVRLTEGLGDAYLGEFGAGIRNRTVEVLLRVGQLLIAQASSRS